MTNRISSRQSVTALAPEDAKRIIEENTRLQTAYGDKLQEVTSLKAQISAKDAQLAAARSQRQSGIFSRLQAAPNSISTAHQRPSRQDDQVKALHSKVAELEEMIAKLNSQLKESTRANAMLRKSLESLHRQLGAANRELGKYTGHTSAKNLLNNKEDDEDEVMNPSTSNHAAVQPSVPHSRLNNASMAHPTTTSNHRGIARSGHKRSRPDDDSDGEYEEGADEEEDEDDDDEDDGDPEGLDEDEDDDSLPNRLRTASLSPEAPRSARPIRQARIEGEVKRIKLQQSCEFTFEIVQRYPTASTEALLDNDERLRLHPSLVRKVAELTARWAKSEYGRLWFLDSCFRPAEQGHCVNTRMDEGLHTLPAGDGRYACQRCVAAKLPCFTFDADDKDFKMLPLRGNDRARHTSHPLDPQYWFNA